MVNKHNRIVNLLLAQCDKVDNTLSDDGWNAESKKLIGMLEAIEVIVSKAEYNQIMEDVGKRGCKDGI